MGGEAGAEGPYPGDEAPKLIPCWAISQTIIDYRVHATQNNWLKLRVLIQKLVWIIIPSASADMSEYKF